MRPLQAKTHKSDKEPNISLIYWLSVIAIVIFIFAFPYQRALFNGYSVQFEANILEAMFFIFPLFLFALVHIFRSWQLSRTQSVLSIAILLLPLIYWISSFSAVSTHSAQVMTLVSCMFAALFILGVHLSDTVISRKVLEHGLLLGGYSIVIFGLFNMFGHIYYPDAIWYTSGTYRMASVFQYSNTYAGFLLALFLCAAYMAVHDIRRFTMGLHAFMLVPIWLSFMLTYSRGALVFVPLLVLMILPFLRLAKQIKFVITLLVSLLASFAILNFVSSRYIHIAEIVLPDSNDGSGSTIGLFDHHAWQGWLSLIVAAGVVTAVILFMNSRAAWLESRIAALSNRKFSTLMIPAFSIIAGLAGSALLLFTNLASFLLPASIAERLQNINFNQHSVLERVTFYEDALKLVTDYPLLGAGGGGWSALYEMYQNNPYVSRQAHSYLMQTLVEIGWIGCFVLVSILGITYYIYLKQYLKDSNSDRSHFIFFIFSAAILFHSMIDFDMSFVYIGCLVFLSLGAMAAVYKSDTLWLQRLKGLNGKWKYAFPSLLLMLTLVVLYQAYTEYSAYRQFRHSTNMAVEEKGQLHQLLGPLNAAIERSPANPTYQLLKIDWLNQAYRQTGDPQYPQAIRDQLAALTSYEPYNRDVILAKYRNFIDLGEYNLAIESLEEGIKKFQWDIKFYEAAMMEYLEAGRRSKESNPLQATEDWERGLALFESVKERKLLLEELPEEQLQGRDFDINSFILQAVGQIYYEQGQFEQSADTLKPLQDEDMNNPFIRQGVRYYLASLDALGQNDENLRNRLIDVDSHERILLDKLIPSN